MEKRTQDASNKTVYDVSIIRPQIQIDDIQLNGQGMSSSRLKSIGKALVTFHILETMAVAIYQFQITKKPSGHNRQLVAAMCNEMTHLQDFQTTLFEYGARPSPLRWAYWLVGFAFGFFSRLRGAKTILKTGIWVETKAVNHYGELLRTIDWDEDTRKMIGKNQADEYEHIRTWQNLLQLEEAEGKV